MGRLFHKKITQRKMPMVGKGGKGGKGGKVGAGKSKRAPTSRSVKAGLQFPVGRIHRFLKERVAAKNRVGANLFFRYYSHQGHFDNTIFVHGMNLEVQFQKVYLLRTIPLILHFPLYHFLYIYYSC